MRKKYISPEMDIIEFDTKDVITTSGIGGTEELLMKDKLMMREISSGQTSIKI